MLHVKHPVHSQGCLVLNNRNFQQNSGDVKLSIDCTQDTLARQHSKTALELSI